MVSRVAVRGCWFVLFIAILACSRASEPSVIYVTATPLGESGTGQPTPFTIVPNLFTPTITPVHPPSPPIQPSPDDPPASFPYQTQQGDSLALLAGTYGITVNDLVALNPGFTAQTALTPGQIMTVPAHAANGSATPNLKIIPDSELVDSPAAIDFNVEQYVRFEPGFLRVYSETVEGRLMSGTDIVNFLAISNSINPRILLALLEYRGGWLSNPVPTQDQMDYPLGYSNPTFKGLFRQLSWAASTLNEGYYDWKYRGLRILTFPDGTRLPFAPGLNAGTVAVQYFLSRTINRTDFQVQAGTKGVYATYLTLFGDPFRYAIDPLVPPDLTMPALQLPFPQGQTWYFTGGPHGGWDAASGWAAIDFAPPAPPDAVIAQQGACFVSDYVALTVASGLVVRSGDGAVVINLDGQPDERIGWSILYLHIADAGRIAAGPLMVAAGTPIGHPSCQGFDLNTVATHLHVARRYNGEWIPSDCWACAANVSVPPFVFGGWKVHGYPAQIYQGMLEHTGQKSVQADQGRTVSDNEISW